MTTNVNVNINIQNNYGCYDSAYGNGWSVLDQMEQSYFNGCSNNDPLSYWPTCSNTQALFDNPFQFAGAGTGYYDSLCPNSYDMSPAYCEQSGQSEDSFGQKCLNFLGKYYAFPFMAASKATEWAGKIASFPMKLAGNVMTKVGEFSTKAGNFIQKGFRKAGEFFGKIPVIGPVLKGVCNLAGWVNSLPMKLAGGILKGIGKLYKGIGDMIQKPCEWISNGFKKVGEGVKNFFKKL